jgi:acetate kinase
VARSLGIARFGFHGLSHAYASRRAAELVGRRGDPDLRVVTCHLGAGASLCATRGGVPSTRRWASRRSKGW